MKQAWLIFRKDVDQFRLEVALNFALIAALCVSASISFDPWNHWKGVTETLLPLNWLFLVARVVQAEPLMGERQFWVTRPYQWKSLLAAKLAFILAFITIPMVASDAIILHAQGFPVGSNASGIAWEMVLRFAYFALFPMVLATLTRSLAGFILATIATLLSFSLYASFAGGVDIHWLPIMIATMLVPVAIFFQYWRRTEMAAGAMVCAVLFAVAAIGKPGFYDPSVTPNGPSLQIELDSQPGPFVSRWGKGNSERTLALPIVIRNLPASFKVVPGGAEVHLSRPTGEVTYATERTRANLSEQADPSRFWLEIPVPEKFYQQAASAKVEVDCIVNLTLYRDLTPVPVQEGRFAVPGVGFCELERNQIIECTSAFRHPQVPIHLGPSGSTTHFARTPFPAQLTVSPVIVSSLGGGDVKEITAGEAVYSSAVFANLGAMRLEDHLEAPKK